MENLIEVNNLVKTFKTGTTDIKVLKNLNFSIQEGEFVSIIGPSGCGKSTLLYILGALDNPTEGSVSINGKNLNKLSDKQKSIVRRRDMGFVFQFYNLVQNLSVEENILLPVLMDGKKTANYKEQLDELLEIIQMQDLRKRTPRELSGGQQQRTSIGRALIAKPSVILADEPTGNLDTKTSQDVMSLLKVTSKKFSQTIVMITHNEEIAQMADRIFVISDGKLEGK